MNSMAPEDHRDQRNAERAATYRNHIAELRAIKNQATDTEASAATTESEAQ